MRNVIPAGFPEPLKMTAIKDVVNEAFRYVEERFFSENKLIGLQTGFEALDDVLCGMQNGDLIIIAARPSMGKTSLGLSIAYNAAKIHNRPVAVYSLEMSESQLALRLICAEARVNMQKLRKGELNSNEFASLLRASQKLSSLPVFINDRNGISARRLRESAERLKSESGLGLVVIDYLQLLAPDRRMENRQQDIASVTGSLKAMAKELDTPVIALSQLSRNVENRQDKRPVMSDLRESGSIEQESDVIIFIYRDDYYKPDSDRKGIAEIIIAKHRNGPTGVVELAFKKEYAWFIDYQV